jgi:ABC-type transport system involved in cytochrome c biogenesis permease subunit
MVAFFSVFIFMFKGRTATFAGLVNRLTSLVAGTTATLVFCLTCRGRFPSLQDWLSLAFILIAVGFLTIAERKRVAELVAEHEIEVQPAAEHKKH